MSIQEADVAAVLHAQFPELQATSVTYLGEGYDSTAFDVDDTWVFRFPKRRDVEQQLLLEVRILPALAAGSPVPLPAYRFRGRPSPVFPHHFGGYPRLRGVPAIGIESDRMSLDSRAPTLARFLSWLHSFPRETAARLGVPLSDVATAIDEAHAEALEDFDVVRDVAQDQPLDAWHAFLADAPRGARSAASADVVVHGDRAIDLSALFHWGGRCLANAVLSAYDAPVDDATLHRARYFAACRGAGDVAFGVRMDRSEYVRAGIRALAQAVPDGGEYAGS